jgi:hypothetical protein
VNRGFGEWLEEEHPSSFLSVAPRAIFFRHLASAFPEMLDILVNTDEAAVERIARIKQALRILCLELETADVGEAPVHAMVHGWHLPPLLECLAFGEDDSERMDLGSLLDLLKPQRVQTRTTSDYAPDQPAPAAPWWRAFSPIRTTRRSDASVMTDVETSVTAFEGWHDRDAAMRASPTAHELFRSPPAGGPLGYLPAYTQSPPGRPSDSMSSRLGTPLSPADSELFEQEKARWMNRYNELTVILTQAAELTHQMGQAALEIAASPPDLRRPCRAISEHSHYASPSLSLLQQDAGGRLSAPISPVVTFRPSAMQKPQLRTHAVDPNPPFTPEDPRSIAPARIFYSAGEL